MNICPNCGEQDLKKLKNQAEGVWTCFSCCQIFYIICIRELTKKEKKSLGLNPEFVLFLEDVKKEEDT